MRFYLDENLSQQVARLARSRGLDVISSPECGRNGLSDAEQLRLAAQEGRCLVTRDDDFFELTQEFLRGRTFRVQGRPHLGVLNGTLDTDK